MKDTCNVLYTNLLLISKQRIPQMNKLNGLFNCCNYRYKKYRDTPVSLYFYKLV